MILVLYYIVYFSMLWYTLVYYRIICEFIIQRSEEVGASVSLGGYCYIPRNLQLGKD